MTPLEMGMLLRLFRTHFTPERLVAFVQYVRDKDPDELENLESAAVALRAALDDAWTRIG